MKKIIMTVALATAAMFGSQAFAQQPGCNPACEPAPCNTDCAPAACAQAPCGAAYCAPDSCAPMRCIPFDGLNLSADQQAKLKELRGKYAPEKRADRAKKALERRKAMLAEIKKVLTPEQYTQFLENNFVNGPQRGPRYKGHHRGNRSDKACRSNRQKPMGYKDSKPRNVDTTQN